MLSVVNYTAASIARLDPMKYLKNAHKTEVERNGIKCFLIVSMKKQNEGNNG